MSNDRIQFYKVKIKDISSVGDGAHASIKRRKEGILYLTSKNFQSGGLELSNVDYISENDYEKHFLKKSNSITNVRENDVVFSIIGSIGMPYIIEKNDEFGLSSSVAILRPDPTKIKPEYLYYWILSDVFQGNLKNIKSGVAQGFISLGMINNLPIMLPSLEKQINITNILSTYDKIIKNNNRRIQILEQTAEELYKEWFVRMRFPGYKNKKFHKGIPEGWKIRRTKDLGKVITGKTPPTNDEENYGDEIMFVKTPDMNGKLFTIATESYLSEKGNDSQPKKLLPKGAIMVSCIGTGGVVSINGYPAHTNQQINSIILNNTHEREWAYFTLRSMKETIELFGATGATMTNLSKGKFEDLKILYPTEKLMIKYNNYTKHIFNKIKNLNLQNKNLVEQRDLILPRLMNGTITVK